MINFIENDIEIDHLEKFASIIGQSPSKGARSPKLWNSVFESLGVNIRMIPLDVKEDKIINLLDYLNENKLFIGGAIAVPYKEIVAKWLNGNISPNASNIGAVNCLFRDDNGKLKGTNTDGEASLSSYKKKFGLIEGKRIMVLGAGGAGKAVASFFATNSNKVIIISRSNKGNEFAQKIETSWASWSKMNDYLHNVDLIINCTSVGFGDQENESPISETQLENLKKTTIIFDIIYQPLKSKFLSFAEKKGLKILNGLDMNLEQAILAFKYTSKSNLNNIEIKNLMSKV